MLFLPYLELAATVSCVPFWTRGYLRWIVGGHVACWRMTVGSHVAAASLVQTENEKQATSIARKAMKKCGREMENVDQKECEVRL